GADDVVQRTWLRALREGPREVTRWRPWLARVARNLTLDHLRDARRRRRREHAAASPEALDSSVAVLQREEQRRRLVDAVLALPQPYRTPVLLRFWDGLGPAAIGRRMGVPAATVRSHLHRGLAMLRQRLDVDHGGRERWLVGLAPLARPSGLGLGLGPILMSTQLKTTGAPCVVLLIGLLAWWAFTPPDATAVDRVAAHDTGAAAGGFRVGSA